MTLWDRHDFLPKPWSKLREQVSSALSMWYSQFNDGCEYLWGMCSTQYLEETSRKLRPLFTHDTLMTSTIWHWCRRVLIKSRVSSHFLTLRTAGGWLYGAFTPNSLNFLIDWLRDFGANGLSYLSRKDISKDASFHRSALWLSPLVINFRQLPW